MNRRIINQTHLDAFQIYLKSEEKSANTIEKYLRDARAFITYLQGNPVTKESLIDYKQKLIDDNYAMYSEVTLQENTSL